MVGPAGPLATISREPGQARKGAAAAVTLCAGVWLVGFTSMTISPLQGVRSDRAVIKGDPPPSLCLPPTIAALDLLFQ